jgi:hypothetical protein
MYLSNCLLRAVPVQDAYDAAREEFEILRDSSKEPFERVHLALTWRSTPVTQPAEAFIALLAERLTGALVAEKRRAYQVEPLDMLPALEAEERSEALALAKDVLEQYQVQFEEDGRLSVTYGGLDEDVAEWLIQIVQELIASCDT